MVLIGESKSRCGLDRGQQSQEPFRRSGDFLKEICQGLETRDMNDFPRSPKFGKRLAPKCIYVCMYFWSSLVAEYESTGLGCQSGSWSAQQGKRLFYCPRSRLIIRCRETGSAVPSRVSLLILHTRAESDWLVLARGIPPAFRDSVHLFL